MKKLVVVPALLALSVVIGSISGKLAHPPGELFAQERTAGGIQARKPVEFWPVTIALVDDLPEERAEAWVLRRVDHHPQDVILLRRSTADGQRLAAAVASLLVARRQQGDAPSRSGRIAVLSSEGPRGWERSELPRAQRVVQRLRRTAPAPISGIGSVPAVTIYLRAAPTHSR